MEFHQEEEEEVLNSPSDSDEEEAASPHPSHHEEEEEEDDDDEEEEEVNEDREEEVDDEDTEEENDDEEEEEEQEEEASSHVIPQSGSSPYVVIHHGRNNCMQTFYSISEGIYSVRRIPEMHGMTCCASSHGWLLMLDNYSVDTKRRSCFLLNLMTSMEKIELPPMKSSYIYINCILTSSPPDCLIMFVSAQDNSCLFCRPKDHKWTLKVFGPKGNNHGNGFNYLNASVSCKGKIYISFADGSGIKILDYTPEDDDVRKIGNRFMVEKIQLETNLLNQFETFHNSETSTDLVESCGDVFMVVRIFLGGSDDVSTLDVYTFNVFKLDSSFSASSNNGGKISWKKVESLGDDRVFFVDKKCSFSASASKTGLMANHIYFFQSYDLRYMYKFKMGSGLITNTLCCPHLVHPVDDPYWML